MAGPYETIKDYLVGLGFRIDDSSFRQFVGKIGELDRIIEKQTGAMSSAWMKSAGIVVGALVSITSATVALMDKAAQADMKFQLFALHMYMSTDSARKFKLAVDSIGYSLQEIAWNPELLGRYKSLMELQRNIAMPGGVEGELRYLRDIRFEFTKMKVEATYGLFWIGHYLTQYLGIPLEKLHQKLQDINKWIVREMPRWTSTVARWMSEGVRLVTPIIRAFGDLYTILKNFWDTLPKLGKAFIVLGAIVSAILIAGPIGAWTAAISGLILLIQDFYAYLDGRKGSRVLGPIWDALLWTLDKIVRTAAMAGVLTRMLLEGREPGESWTLGYMKKIWKDLGELSPIRRPEEGKPGSITGKGLAGIGKTESGGNYGAVNSLTGAKGKYQIMPQNWDAWAREAGLGEMVIPTPENQEKVAAFKYNQYLKMFGGNEQLVAAAWYGGPGIAQMLQAGRLSQEALNRVQKGGYPSINDYIRMSTGSRWGEAGGGVQVQNSVGELNVYVTNPNASAEEIAKVTRHEFQKYTDNETLKLLRELQGVVE